MDTIIQKKSSKLKWAMWSVLGLALLSVFGWYWFQQKKTFNIAQDSLRISEVQNGNFEDMLLISAQTQSMHSSLVNVLEGGVVKEIFVEDGVLVKKNQPLARVYNPNTELNYMNQDASMMQQISQMQSALIELKGQEFNQNKENLQAQNELNVAQQQFNLQKRLYDAEIGRKTDYDMAQQALEYQLKRKAIIERSRKVEDLARQKQVSDIQRSIAQMQKGLEVLRENKNNFLILAPENGRLSSFTISLGENLTSGQNIGKVDLMDGYKLLAKVDEYYLNKIQSGIKGTLEIGDKVYGVFINKVLPEVKDGQFFAELYFDVKQQPAQLSMGMTFSVKLKFSQDTQSLLIPKGNFYKDTGGKWIFVVKDHHAERRAITLGRENSMYYEVTSGLKAGEQVVTSDYTDFKNYQILNIK